MVPHAEVPWTRGSPQAAVFVRTEDQGPVRWSPGEAIRVWSARPTAVREVVERRVGPPRTRFTIWTHTMTLSAQDIPPSVNGTAIIIMSALSFVCGGIFLSVPAIIMANSAKSKIASGSDDWPDPPRSRNRQGGFLGFRRQHRSHRGTGCALHTDLRGRHRRRSSLTADAVPRASRHHPCSHHRALIPGTKTDTSVSSSSPAARHPVWSVAQQARPAGALSSRVGPDRGGATGEASHAPPPAVQTVVA